MTENSNPPNFAELTHVILYTLTFDFGHQDITDDLHEQINKLDSNSEEYKIIIHKLEINNKLHIITDDPYNRLDNLLNSLNRLYINSKLLKIAGFIFTFKPLKPDLYNMSHAVCGFICPKEDKFNIIICDSGLYININTDIGKCSYIHDYFNDLLLKHVLILILNIQIVYL